jgi:uncharacterized integral membrane protein (TIGR00697 family)
VDIYRLASVKVDQLGQTVATIKAHSVPKGYFDMPVTKIVQDKAMLTNFNSEDIINLVGLTMTENSININETRKLGNMKYLSILSMIFIITMVASNIGSSKLASVFGFTITGGMLAFNLSYIVSDIITEVYGYKRSRQLIWCGLACNLCMMGLLFISIKLPPAPEWHNQAQFELILGAIPRILLASLVSYTVGEFVNASVLVKFKLKYSNLFLRIAMSSMLGILCDTVLFTLIAFWSDLSILSMTLLAIKYTYVNSSWSLG